MKWLTLVTFAVLSVFYFVNNVQSLECGIDNSKNQKDLREIAENCMKKKVVEVKKPLSDDDEEDATESSSKDTKRNKRSEDNNQHNSDNTDLNKHTDNTNSTDKDNCIVHCVFGQLGMNDNNGFPEHHRVSQALLRHASGREVRDFIQDTTDECFQLMEQDNHQDACQFSISLVNCLAERGKSNCADWPVGNLSFLTKKN